MAKPAYGLREAVKGRSRLSTSPIVHHREDLCPDPYAGRPERWLRSRSARA
jgi:hypothetical protein